MEVKFKPDTDNNNDDDAKKPPFRPCEICKANNGAYTCPRCNILYCGLECYRNSDKHLACSETFYKEQVISELKMCKLEENDLESRTRMLDILKREAKCMEKDELVDVDPSNTATEANMNVDEDEMLKFYRRNISDWKPWWRTLPPRKLVSEDTESALKSDNLNLNLLKNSSLVNISKASALLHNDILLTCYSYLVLCYVYQLERNQDDLDSIGDEFATNFLDIDKVLVNTDSAKRLELTSRLDLAVQSLTRDERTTFLKDYVTPTFLISVFDELAFVASRSDLKIQVLSHIYDMIESFVRKSVTTNVEENPEVPINVFHLNKEVKKMSSGSSHKPRVTILNCQKSKVGGLSVVKATRVEELPSSGTTLAKKTSVKDGKLILKRLEFYYRWLKFSESRLESADSQAAIRSDIEDCRQKLADEMKQRELEKGFLEMNLDKLRSMQKRDGSGVKLIEEI